MNALLFAEFLKIFPKKSLKGLVFGAGIGLLSLDTATNFNGDTHLLAHQISGVFSFIYLGLSLFISSFSHAYKAVNSPRYSFSFYFLGGLLGIIFLLFSYCFTLLIQKGENEFTYFLTGWVDKFLGNENGEGYFVAFIICYAITCFLLSGLLETLYDAWCEVKENNRVISRN